MVITVTESSRTASQMGEYFSALLTDGKREVSVVLAPAKCHNPVHVLVTGCSAMGRRGFGRNFPTIEAAVAGYKTQAVQEMIRYAAELNAARQPTTVEAAMLADVEAIIANAK